VAPRITSLAFLAPGNCADDDPYAGLEDTLQLFEYGERLGYDGAWIRQRHLEHGVGSAAVSRTEDPRPSHVNVPATGKLRAQSEAVPCGSGLHALW
jgi:hypothetical protein